MVYTLAVFFSAALLFLAEPMFGKMVLPWLGGSPSVWTTCMLFFQAALLLGYLYAHLGPRWLGVRRHALLHLSLLVLWLLALPVRMIVIPGTLRVEHPTAWLITVLGWSIAAPFILLSSTGPLLQVWFSRTSHPGAQNPYFLYAASNSGSLRPGSLVGGRLAKGSGSTLSCYADSWNWPLESWTLLPRIFPLGR